MEERMLALEKAIKKSLEEPSQTMGGQPTYALAVAPAATKAAVRIRLEGAEKMQPAELL